MRRTPLIQYAVRSGTKRSAGGSHGAGSAQTASDGARSLAPGLGPSHGAGERMREGDTVRGTGGEKQSEPGKVDRGPHQTASGGDWRSSCKAPAAWCLRMRQTTCVVLGPRRPWAPEAHTRVCAGRSAVFAATVTRSTLLKRLR